MGIFNDCSFGAQVHSVLFVNLFNKTDGPALLTEHLMFFPVCSIVFVLCRRVRFVFLVCGFVFFWVTMFSLRYESSGKWSLIVGNPV